MIDGQEHNRKMEDSKINNTLIGNLSRANETEATAGVRYKVAFKIVVLLSGAGLLTSDGKK